jgi:hypothetical protein
METLNAVEKLWDLANLITGFAVVQSLAVTFGLVKRDLKMLRGPKAHWSAAVGTLLFTVGYVAAVEYCGKKGRCLDVANADIWCWVTLGRTFSICVFALITVGTIYLHRRDLQAVP